MSVKGKRMRYNQNSLVQQSLSLGKGRNYFSSMKVRNIPKFNYIEELGEGNVALGYYSYIDEREKVLNEFLNLYSELETRRAVSAFTRAYNYTPFSIHKLGTRMLKFKMSFKQFEVIKNMNSKINEYIEKNTRRIG